MNPPKAKLPHGTNDGRTAAGKYSIRKSVSYTDSLLKLTHKMRTQVEKKLERIQQIGLVPGDCVEKPWGMEDCRVYVLRLSKDFRLVFTRKGTTIRPFFAGHHDAAYRFANKNRDKMAKAG